MDPENENLGILRGEYAAILQNGGNLDDVRARMAENRRQIEEWDRTMSGWTDEDWAAALDYAAGHLPEVAS